MRSPRIGPPRRVLAAALVALEQEGLAVLERARVIESRAIGPSLRRYANSAAVIESALDPPALLAVLQAIEQRFGRTRAQRRGQRWRARVLDLDIALWSGGVWASPALTIPHRELRSRAFVLGPASRIAAGWRDPVSGLTLAQAHARLTRRRRLPRGAPFAATRSILAGSVDP